VSKEKDQKFSIKHNGLFLHILDLGEQKNLTIFLFIAQNRALIKKYTSTNNQYTPQHVHNAISVFFYTLHINSTG